MFRINPLGQTLYINNLLPNLVAASFLLERTVGKRRAVEDDVAVSRHRKMDQRRHQKASLPEAIEKRSTAGVGFGLAKAGKYSYSRGGGRAGGRDGNPRGGGGDAAAAGMHQLDHDLPSSSAACPAISPPARRFRRLPINNAIALETVRLSQRHELRPAFPPASGCR